MDRDIARAVYNVILVLEQTYPKLTFELIPRLMLTEIIAQLKRQYPKYSKEFTTVLPTSFIRPDGGLLYALNERGDRRLILVSEVKRQGTNDQRELEGLPQQAQGNAIERLGKNLIGVRAIFKNEGALPFVCFGSGHDFKEDSSIVDRVKTMNEFFPLNKLFIEKDFLPFEPVSMFFRYEVWTADEMAEIMLQIAKRSIEYTFI